MWTSNDMGMGKLSIKENGRNRTGAEESWQIQFPAILRSSVDKVHQSLFSYLEADMTALMQKEKDPSIAMRLFLIFPHVTRRF